MKAEIVTFTDGRYGVKVASTYSRDAYLDLQLLFTARYTWSPGDKYFPYCKTRFRFIAERALKKFLRQYEDRNAI